MTQAFYGSPPGFTDPEDEDTIEMQLSPEQVLELSRADAAAQAAPVAIPAPSVAVPSNDMPVPRQCLVPIPIRRAPVKGRFHGLRIAGLLSIAVASVSVSAVAYLGTAGVRPNRVAADRVTGSTTPEALTQSLTDNAPVRFTNPFDTAEVFEFLPGTSETDAHDAVANLLLERARTNAR